MATEAEQKAPEAEAPKQAPAPEAKAPEKASEAPKPEEKPKKAPETKDSEKPKADKPAEKPTPKPEGKPEQKKPEQKPESKDGKPKPTSKPTPKPAPAPKKESGLLVFNRWACEHIEVQDLGLKKYLSVKPVIVPKTGARYAGNRFHKSKINIVERLINRVMIPGHKAKKHKISSGQLTGKANTAYDLVYKTFEIIEKKTKKNPIEVLVRAIENAAPREEIITIEYGGARYPKPVECAPQRRIDVVLRLMTQGAYHKAFDSKKSSASALADEIIFAYQSSPNSAAISKKAETERQADSSR